MVQENYETMEVALPEIMNKHELTLKEEFSKAKEDCIMSMDVTDSMEDKKKIYKAMNETDDSLRNLVGEEIRLANYIVHKISVKNQVTGEVNDTIRCVLITDDGKSYGTTSKGVTNALIKLVQFLGEPKTWNEPVIIKICEKQGKNGFKFLSFDLV